MIKWILLFVVLFKCGLDAQIVFPDKPDSFKPQVEAAACFIKVDDHILFLKRQYNKPEGNTWGVPGGKLDKGETATAAVVREVSEEAGIDLKKADMSYFGKVYIKDGERQVILHLFEAELNAYPTNVVLNPVEHQEYTWVTLDDSLKLPLIPGEEEIESLYTTYSNA
jgi:mutator protein MutT